MSAALTPNVSEAIPSTQPRRMSPPAPLSPAAINSAQPRRKPPQGALVPEPKPTPIPISTAVPGTSSPAASNSSQPMYRPPQGMLLFDPYLFLLSDSLDQIEDLRKATNNRVRALTRNETDSDGEMRGLGLDARSPQVARAMALAEDIKALEHKAVLDLQKAFRQTPFRAWQERSLGVGEKQAARLLAVIGDPYWNDLHNRPRTVSELWAYSGYAVHSGRADRRQKGMQQNWNDKAKSRAFLIAEKCMIQLDGDYRKVYDAARAQYAEAVHPHDCTRCGPKGKPALAGSPLSLGHQHARALRRVAKEILKDLWIEARAYHESEMDIAA